MVYSLPVLLSRASALVVYALRKPKHPSRGR